MKIGFQTIVWGPRVRNLEYMLDVIATAGYQGVEFMQRPEVLGSIDGVLHLLETRGLELIGLSGGSLLERMEFCGDFRPPYLLYVDTWKEEEARKAMEAGFTVGLQPHAYMPVGDFADALGILEEHPPGQYPRLKFAPDTAHLTVTHDDPVKAIEMFRDKKDRLVAVHLKDWTPEFGRAAHRYARGFAELGTGCVDLHAVIQALRDGDYGGWLIVEQEYTLTDPDTNTFASASWLAKEGLLPEPAPQKLPTGLRAARNREVCRPKREVLFAREIARARVQQIGQFYEGIAAAFRRLIPCKLVEVWSSAPNRDVMSLLAIKPDILACARDAPVRLNTLIEQRDDVLSGITMERKAITRFDLRKKGIRERFEHPELVEELNLTTMLSIPIFNPWNFNHIRLIVNLVPSDEKTILSDDELFRFGINAALALDSVLEDMCSASARRVNFEAAKSRNIKEFLASLVNLVGTCLGCERVAIFLASDSGERLELMATTGTTWNVPEGERFYRKGEGLTGWVWEDGETLLTVDAGLSPHRKGKSYEGSASDVGNDCLLVPLGKVTGEVIGVVRCHTENASRFTRGLEQSFLFSEDDACVLESIAQAAVPHIEVLLAEKRRAKAWGRLTHELKVPLVAIRGAAASMVRTPGADKCFDYDYPGDIWSWSELMGRLIDNADIARYGTGRLEMRPERTRLVVHVIAPAIRQAGLVLRERGFSSKEVTCSNEVFRQFPEMWLDRNRFQQVIFNLLSNAVKYAYEDPGSFKVEIDGAKDITGFTIWFRDWGMGIAEGIEEMIFEDGVRGEAAVEKNVAGQGLGLFVVRQIVESHCGTVRVSNRRQPTEIEMKLPYSLSQGPRSL